MRLALELEILSCELLGSKASVPQFYRILDIYFFNSLIDFFRQSVLYSKIIQNYCHRVE